MAGALAFMPTSLTLAAALCLQNYSPYKQQVDALSCTGDPFYTWGGLMGALSFAEAERQS